MPQQAELIELERLRGPLQDAQGQVGQAVDVAWIGGAKIRSSGNSFATPHMSGICALILAKHPELTPFQLKSVLYLTASNVGGAE